jgi:hypothetical protein
LIHVIPQDHVHLTIANVFVPILFSPRQLSSVPSGLLYSSLDQLIMPGFERETDICFD